jgi:hypothetical protein
MKLSTTDKLAALVEDIAANDSPSLEQAPSMRKAIKVLRDDEMAQAAGGPSAFTGALTAEAPLADF